MALSIQPPQLGLAVGPGLIGLYICSVIFLSRYHLTREQHGVVLAALATREARREHARAYGTNS